MSISIKRYSPEDAPIWYDFVEKARNGHFMFHRAYMDYHSDRFNDHSLLFYHKEKLVALLPANEKEKDVHSHQGLTYGGLIISEHTNAQTVLNIFEELLTYFKTLSFTKLTYKALPYIYFTHPTQEDQYALFRNNASLVKTELSSCISLQAPDSFLRADVKRKFQRAKRLGCTIRTAPTATALWPLIDQVLNKTHGVIPTHSLKEINHLIEQFPQNILVFEVLDEGKNLIGGTVLYLTKHVVHVQYSASNEAGRYLGALPFLFCSLIHEFRTKGYAYFNFGNSNEQQGQVLNTSLNSFKESFGARGLALNTYSINL